MPLMWSQLYEQEMVQTFTIAPTLCQCKMLLWNVHHHAVLVIWPVSHA